MYTAGQSLNSSSISSKIDCNEDAEIVKSKQFVKDLLKSRIFLGRYIERRLINKHIGYRDIVLISGAEVELKKDLILAQERLRLIYQESHWIGISDSHLLGFSGGLYLSTEIDNEPLGPFWFQIKSVKFRQNETMISLKCIRHISDAFLELEPLLTGTLDKKRSCNQDSDKDNVKLKESCDSAIDNLKNALSITNIKDFLTFIFAFVIAVFTGSTSFVNFLGNFILALIREFSILIKNFTPMFLGFLDFLSKIVGGFYILLAMFFKPNNAPRQNKRSIAYDHQTSPDFRYRNFD